MNRSSAVSALFTVVLAGTFVVTLTATAEAAPDAKMKDIMRQISKMSAVETDAAKLVPLLNQAKALKPSLPEMAPLFDATLKAAASGDMKATNATCTTCHKAGGEESAREKYKRQFGSKAP